MFEINGKTYNAKPIPGDYAFGRYNIYRMLRDGEKSRGRWEDKETKNFVTEIVLRKSADDIFIFNYASPKEAFAAYLLKHPEDSEI